MSDAGRVQAGNDSFTLGTGVPEMVMSDSGENGNLVVSHGSTINGVTTSVIGGTAGYTGTATVSGMARSGIIRAAAPCTSADTATER